MLRGLKASLLLKARRCGVDNLDAVFLGNVGDVIHHQLVLGLKS